MTWWLTIPMGPDPRAARAWLDRRCRARLAAVTARFRRALLDAVERAATKRRELDHAMQEHLRDDHRREERDGNADPERQREPLHGAGPELEEDHRGQDRGQVRIEDRREGALAAFLHGHAQGLSGSQLFFEALERQHVGID